MSRWVVAAIWLWSTVHCFAQATGAAQPTGQEPSPQQLFITLSPSVFVVESYNKRGVLVATGSAVAVDQHTAITNCHVLRTGAQWALTRNDHQWPVSVARRNTDRDLCEISSPSLSATPVTIRDSSDVKVGERVFAIGAPKGLEATLSEGLVSGLRAFRDGRVIQTTAPISPGSSGGGLFDGEGRLIGITSFGFRDSQSLNFALPSAWILALDSTLSAEQRTRPHAPDSDASQRPDGIFGTVMQTAASAFNAGDYDKAASLYRQALEMRPDNVIALTTLGQLDITRSENYSAAQTLCGHAVSLDAQSAEGWACLGDAYVGLSMWDSAETAYRKAVTLRPSDASSWLGVGEVLAAKGDRDGVLRVYEKLRPLNQDIANWFYAEFVAKTGPRP